MNGGGGDPTPPSLTGGDFLLQLLRNPPQQQHQHQPLPPPAAEVLPHDPAVARVGPMLPVLPFPSNGDDLIYRPPWPPQHPHQFAPHHFFVQGFPQNPNPNWSSPPSQPPHGFSNSHPHPQFNQNLIDDGIRKRGIPVSNTKSGSKSNPSHSQPQSLVFGSLPPQIRNSEGASNGHSYNNVASAAKVDSSLSSERQVVSGSNGIVNPIQFGSRSYQSSSKIWNHQQHTGIQRSAVPSSEVRRPQPPPPGFNREFRRSSLEPQVNKGKSGIIESNQKASTHNDDHKRERSFRGPSKAYQKRDLESQHDSTGPADRSNLPSASASDVEESLLELHAENGENGVEHQMGSLELEDGSGDKNDKKQHNGSRSKDYRSDKRGQWLLGQRMRVSKRQIELRHNIERLNSPFLQIYESLIPAEEEKAKQKQLLSLLEKLVSREWPDARLYIYGSCDNSFGFSKSDIDVCLLIEDADVNKSEVLLKLAGILESDNLQNVQALTRARVPIVKLLDPTSGISCDICVNNALAVVNTKLLRDYAKIDSRLRQLAFIVKHWAKSRGVNQTYQGTLSSYAYVLMCIHFLQLRKPSILPCLQGMMSTYSVTIDNVEYSYFDQVEKLHDFGSCNGESIAELVWGFFNYWAYWHDYATDVISIRTGSILSKRAKDWTRRIGNDRHLICIEDPFEVSHDLGRVVDKFTIKVLREEFERAAEIMQYDPDPCTRLFEPYVPT